MKRTHGTDSGFRIQSKPAPAHRASFCVQGLSALVMLLGLLCLADLLLELSGLSSFPVLIAAGAAVCLGYALFALLQKANWLTPILLGGVLLTGAVFYGEAIAGVRLICNHAFAYFTSVTGRIFLQFSIEANPQYQTLALSLALGLLGVLLAVLSWHTANRWPKAVSLCLLVFLAAELLAFWPEAGDSRVWIVMLSALFLYCGDAGIGNKSWKMALVRMVGIFFCAALCVVAVSAFSSVRDGSLFHRLRSNTQQQLHDARYETEDAVILPEGDFSRLQGESLPEAAVLTVMMEQPEALYLRGFVGDTFDGSDWKTLSTEKLAEYSGLLYWLHENGFYPQAQLSAAAGLLPEEESVNRVTVNNLLACSRYLYVPYHFSSFTAGGALSAYDLDTATLSAEGLRGVRAYAFTTVDGSSETLEALTEFLRENKDETTLSYLSAEGSYRELVYQYDLDFPSGALARLQPILDACCGQFGSREELTRTQAQVSTWLFLQQYEEKLRGGEAILPELGEAVEGSAYERATVTVLALRYFGIPARYAEGFLITQEMAAGVQPGESLALTAEQATAWVEIYQDGLGWLPMELTPGYQALSGAVDENSGKSGEENGKLPEGEELEAPDSPNQTNTQDTPRDRSQTRLPRPGELFLWFLLIPVLLLPGVWLRHHWILKKRSTGFQSEHISDAVGFLFADSAKLLSHMGLDRGGASMHTLCGPVSERFGQAYAKRFDELLRLNGEALFSSHPLEEKHRELAKDFRAETCHLLVSQSNWLQRLWIRWIRCLY